MTTISRRKEDHLDLAITGDVGFRKKTTLFECVQLIHDALPEMHLDEVDLTTRLFGRTLRAPIILAAMTGGTSRAERINQKLAAIAEELGYGFGLGSQRAMLENPDCASSYQMRKIAPTSLILGNIGGVQAMHSTPEALAQLVADVQADALCVHLNPAMEVVQHEGDRNFRGVAEAIRLLVAQLPVPVVVKETGCGLSAATAKRLRSLGVNHVDTSGAGGTSWVAVETQRASNEHRAVGNAFWDWGIPTAASLLQIRPSKFQTVIATGGVASGLDAAKALALGATAVGIARPVLQVLERDGHAAAINFLRQVERELRTACFLSGAQTARQMSETPRIVGGQLSQWAPPTGTIH